MMAAAPSPAPGTVQSSSWTCVVHVPEIPGITADVRRPHQVAIRATNLEGQEFSLAGEDLLARVWQHENDHLDGIMIIDKMMPMDRLRCRKALKELEADAIEDKGVIP